MSNATPQSENLITPEAARLIWEQYLPGAPATGTALYYRSRRGTGPPYVLDGEGPRARVRYDPVAVRAWCLAQQPAKIQAAVAAPEAMVRWLEGREAEPDHSFLPAGCQNHDPAHARDQAAAWRSGARAAVAALERVLGQEGPSCHSSP